MTLCIRSEIEFWTCILSPLEIEFIETGHSSFVEITQQVHF